MTDPKSKPVQLVPWDSWQDKLSTSLMIGLLLLIAAFLAFYTTFDYPVSHQASTCRLKNWGFWLSGGKVGSQSARIVAKCLLTDGKQIDLSQPLDWTPPDFGTEIKIEIVNNKLSGPYYYAK